MAGTCLPAKSIKTPTKRVGNADDANCVCCLHFIEVKRRTRLFKNGKATEISNILEYISGENILNCIGTGTIICRINK
jgi:hypothetical protein